MKTKSVPCSEEKKKALSSSLKTYYSNLSDEGREARRQKARHALGSSKENRDASSQASKEKRYAAISASNLNPSKKRIDSWHKTAKNLAAINQELNSRTTGTPQHRTAKKWRFRSPKHQIIEGKNLIAVIMENKSLFDPRDLLPSPGGHQCRAKGGLAALYSNRLGSSWKGWTALPEE